eukprot:TRINITY_DN7900_c0_g1_i2.p1 TRINITY_DN7900_c0_g1~~TRINITY_DN7900_c0_g1_i2.p1  ORF type:complete len:149 (+),score=8.06 TRINITY_DN7900_c0_g1_i2:21-467(+)
MISEPSGTSIYKRAVFCSYGSGILFAAAWWIFIDGCVWARHNDDPQQVIFAFYIPGFLSTLALFMMNVINWSEIKQNSSFGEGVNPRVKAWLFVAFLMSFSCIVGAVFILIDKFKGGKWPGIALVLQNVLILASSLLLWFGRGAGSSD